MLDQKIWLAHPGIELGPPEDTKTIRYLSIKIKTKSPGNFVTPTADLADYRTITNKNLLSNRIDLSKSERDPSLKS